MAYRYSLLKYHYYIIIKMAGVRWLDFNTARFEEALV